MAPVNTSIVNFTIGGLSGFSSDSLLDNTSPTPVAVNLTVGNNNNTGMTYSGILSGTGATLIKTGTGMQTLSGANTYTDTGMLTLLGTGGAASGPHDFSNPNENTTYLSLTDRRRSTSPARGRSRWST